MRTADLLTVLLAARIAALAGHAVDVSRWSAVAYIWQDAAVALIFACLDFALRRRPRFAWTAYAVVAGYVVLNVGVTRVLSSPLTLPMLRAARGPLSDSIWHYVSLDNLAWTTLVAATAVVAPWSFSALDRRAIGRILRTAVPAGLTIVAALGPAAVRRVDTRGLDRNAWTALAMTAMPRAGVSAAAGDWRRPRADDQAERAIPSGLATLRGAAAGRHIVMVSLESTAAQYLGLYGAVPDVMPNLSALAHDGVVFDNAYAVYPESIKGLFSIICSQYPFFDRAADAYARVACPSLPAILAERGYRTALFHSGRFGYLGMEAVIRHRGYELLADAGDIGGNRESSFGVDEPSTVARVLEWIDQRRAGERFFVTYLPIAGHHPYESPASDSEADQEEFSRYQRALRYADAAVGALIRGVRERGLEDQTIWIVFGDHGEAFGQHDGNYGHTFQIYDENVRVPLLVAVPGRVAGPLRSARVASLIDTAPTVLDLIGVSAPADYQGRSLLSGEPRMALFFADYSLGFLGARDGNIKYIYEIESGRDQLFDLAADPAELQNLAARDPATARWYAQRLRSWIR
jgi:glucan phosphoethanolaminetransferase (alkaline phosphatase superfamily)